MTSAIWLIRHAETEWSLAGRHTGRTDLPLTESGREAAKALAPCLAGVGFETVLTSPLRRARETCELCGLGDRAQALDDLMEWDYGQMEGMTTAEIRAHQPGWSLWHDGCPGGESVRDVGARADAVISGLLLAQGPAAVFAHGHVLRVIAARWIEAAPNFGERLMFGAGAISVLGEEHGARALQLWNAISGFAS
jgi:probable phosphoglycerate mutase